MCTNIKNVDNQMYVACVVVAVGDGGGDDLQSTDWFDPALHATLFCASLFIRK